MQQTNPHFLFQFTDNLASWEDFSQYFEFSTFFNSLALLFFIFTLRYFLIRGIKRNSLFLSRDQRRWVRTIKTTSLSIILIGLALIWAPHLRTFALSIAAFAVALVIATKEMILCLMGALVRVTTHPFRIGDWITLENITGEVIDINAFTITLQEIDMVGRSYNFTGRTAQIPNSKFFTSNIENANFNKEYAYTDFVICVAQNDHPKVDDLLDSLALITDKHFSPFRERAYAFRRKVENKALIDLPDPEPSIILKKDDADSLRFIIRAFIPITEIETFSHRVTRDFLVENLSKKNVKNTKK
jgi:small-conductance mechanosensitive channel